ncbi:MAG: DNA primase [Bdellovibrionales bacterium]|nr:DNA primase [Bdellovibrionales bacterium]
MSLDDLIKQIKDTPVTQIVGRFIALKRQGNTVTAICPFHSDTKPSLHVNDSKGLFKCFVCQAGGDSITFVEKYQSLSFIESLKEIASIIGLDYSNYSSSKKNPELVMAQKILTKTAQIYRKLGTDSGSNHLSTFIKDRNLTIETSTQFMLGYAPSNNIITNYLKSIPDEKERNFALEVAKKISIIKVNENNHSCYDTFRNRIMFPIWDLYGQVTGFTSRAVLESQKPKYLNSKESFIFSKKNLQYGLHLAKAHIREKGFLILCEGNMDAITLHQFNFKNSLAIMGTALTENSVKTYSKLTSNIILALDSDPAGMEAMKRANSMFLECGVIPKFIIFDPCKDPDEFLNDLGPIELQERIDNSVTYLDYGIEQLTPEKIPELIEDKYSILQNGFELLSPLGNSLAATERLMSLANKLGLKSGPDQIAAEYDKHLESNRKSSRIKENFPANQEEIFQKELIKREKSLQKTTEIMPSRQLTKGVKDLVNTLIIHPECFKSKELPEVLDLVWLDEVKRYVNELKTFYFEVEDTEYPNLILNLLNTKEFSTELKEIIGSTLYNFQIRKPIEDSVVSKLLFDIKTNLNKDKLKLKREELKTMQNNSTTLNEVHSILKEINKIQTKLEEIKLQKN